MKTIGTVKFALDPANPPKRNPEELGALAALRDEDIDFSDIPETTSSDPRVVWQRPGLLVPTQNKQQITLRLDAEVLAFFKNTGPRYQSRINEVLRAYIKAQDQPSK